MILLLIVLDSRESLKCRHVVELQYECSGYDNVIIYWRGYGTAVAYELHAYFSCARSTRSCIPRLSLYSTRGVEDTRETQAPLD